MVPQIRKKDNSAVSLAKESKPSTTAPTTTSKFSKYTGTCNYLTEDGRDNIKTYTYRGTDMSLLYRYILSPLAALLVDTCVPKSMAPNTVTSIGLLWMVTAYVTYWYYVPGLELTEKDVLDGNENYESFPPRWIFLWNGISILAYQTLDNMDGKQARRTGSSSPLGLLFDHGCDAINSIFGSANLIIGMHLNPSENMFEVWLLIFGPFVMFYIATWEQFFTGELVLPIINGPSDGLLLMALHSFVSYWLGSQYWQQTDVFDAVCSMASFNVATEDVKLRNCDLIVIAFSIGALQEIIIKSLAVTRKYKGSFEVLIPVFVLALCYLIIGYIDRNIWLALPRTSLHLSMVLFVDMTTELMLAHVTAQPFFPWRWQVTPLIGITFWVTMFGNSDGIKYFIILYAWVMGGYLLMKSIRIISEICNVLKIWCFDIVTPHYSVGY